MKGVSFISTLSPCTFKEFSRRFYPELLTKSVLAWGMVPLWSTDGKHAV